MVFLLNRIKRFCGFVALIKLLFKLDIEFLFDKSLEVVIAVINNFKFKTSKKLSFILTVF